MPDSDVTVDYCARRNWLVGSPSTVAEKIETIYREVGGFGTLLVFGFDYKHKPEAWHNSHQAVEAGSDAAAEASQRGPRPRGVRRKSDLMNSNGTADLNRRPVFHAECGTTARVKMSTGQTAI